MTFTIIINLTHTIFPGETGPVRNRHGIGRDAATTKNSARRAKAC